MNNPDARKHVRATVRLALWFLTAAILGPPIFAETLSETATTLRDAALESVADLTQDGTYYFNYHQTDDDILNKVDRGALAQNLAAYTTPAYAVETETRLKPAPVRPERRRQ